jgi:hypothetical protein
LVDATSVDDILIDCKAVLGRVESLPPASVKEWWFVTQGENNAIGAAIPVFLKAVSAR